MSYLNTLWRSLRGVQPNFIYGTEDTYVDNVIPQIINGKAPFKLNNADQIATVYTCAKIYADSVSRLPINVIKLQNDGSKLVDKTDSLYPLLHYQPNSYSTPHKFFSTLEYMRNLNGNAYAEIIRNGSGNVLSLKMLSPSRFIEAKINTNGNLIYKFHDEKIKDKVRAYPAENILHFYNVTKDGITGVSPLTALRLGLSTTWKGMKTIDTMYDQELRTTKALKYPSMVPNKKAQKEAIEQFQSHAAGAQAPGVITLPDGADLIDLQITLADAEFIQTIKFNKSDIASAFRIPLTNVGLLEATKWNSVEAMGREFLNQGLGDVLKMYRSELEFKLLSLEQRMAGVSIEFNTNAMLDVDSKTRWEGYKTLIQQGIMTPNQAAALENWPTYPEGDNHWMPSNFIFTEDRNNGANVNKSQGI